MLKFEIKIQYFKFENEILNFKFENKILNWTFKFETEIRNKKNPPIVY